jgi:Ankyrin repeats (3 copies)
MPAKQFPSQPDLNHLKYQAKDLLKGHAAHDRGVAQRIREFNPRFKGATDAEIFESASRLSDAQFTIAREYGFKSWARLKAHVESPELAGRLKLPHHERIENAVFRHAVELLDAGDTAGLRDYLKQHPKLVQQHVEFESGNYFHSAALLEFIAENPIRHGALPKNIVEVAKVILDAGPDQTSRNVTLALVATGSVTHECGVQLPLIDLLCNYGADPDSAIHAAALHGYFQTVTALIARGAHIDLPIAAVLNRVEDARRLLPAADGTERHLALAVASQVGHIEIVRLLLDAGEDPNRYNPPGGHAHTTPLHQAALIGHEELVRLLIERGARADTKDLLWRGTPADWARHEGRTELEAFLRALEKRAE